MTRRQSAAAASMSPDSSSARGQKLTSVQDETEVVPASEDPSSRGEGHSQPSPKKKSDLLVRAVSGLTLTGLFYAFVAGGHMWCAIAVIAMEIGMFNEILRLGFPVAKSRRIPLWRTTGWYFFSALLFLLYGKVVLSHFYDQALSFTLHPIYLYALHHHTFLSFCMYCTGFVGFVLSLRNKDQYHFQFTYFGRALVALILVVVQSHFMILNISLGLIWFILPCWLIIVNDSFGYFCGRLFGKHSLTALSPKKTWEGYIGAGVSTMITAFFLSGFLSQFQWLVCPKYDFNDCFLTCPPVTCDPLPSVFLKQVAEITLIPGVTPTFSLTFRPVQLHAIALGLFASSIAPFGGFFASGAKRAFGIKDFGGLLPGHGGVTDRVDCQLMMAVFTYVYLINFVKVNFVGSPDVGRVMSFVSELSTSEQVELLTEIYIRLQRRGVTGLLSNVSNVSVPTG